MSSTTVFKGSFGEKPSSRVLRPPGGGSSNIFGQGDEIPQSIKATGPSKATDPPKAAENPNSTDPPKATEQPKATDPPRESALQTPEAVKEEAPHVASPQVKELSKEASRIPGNKEQQKKPQPSQAAVPSRFRNSGFNPITGEPYPDAKVQATAEDKKQTTSIIVKQPPGGASSGLW